MDDQLRLLLEHDPKTHTALHWAVAREACRRLRSGAMTRQAARIILTRSLERIKFEAQRLPGEVGKRTD